MIFLGVQVVAAVGIVDCLAMPGLLLQLVLLSVWLCRLLIAVLGLTSSGVVCCWVFARSW